MTHLVLPATSRALRKFASAAVAPPSEGPSADVAGYQAVHALLRAIHWNLWTTHWQISGVPAYGDHLLFQRLYEAAEGEIDALAEKLVAMGGPEAVEPVQAATKMQEYLANWGAEQDPIARALQAEETLQASIKEVSDAGTASGQMSLGMGNFLAGVADAHETNIYLLKQRLRG